jgi:hypothetical protein
MSVVRHLLRAKPATAQLYMLLLGLCIVSTCQARVQDKKQPDVGAAMEILAYYYEPLLAASVPKRHPDLARVFAAIDAAHYGRPRQAITALDKIAHDPSFNPRGQVLALFLKVRLEADRNRRLDGWDSSQSDALLDETRRRTASDATHAAFVAANKSKRAFLPNAISTIEAFDEVLERCLVRKPWELQAKTREALVRHLHDGADVPNQDKMLNVEASPLIDRCLSDFDRLAGSVSPTSALTTSTSAALRLEIIASEVLAATLHGRLDISQDVLQELVMVFQETAQPVKEAGDFCAEAWLWLRFARLQMRPSGSIATLGLDLRFEEMIYPWLMDRINSGPNAAYFAFKAPPNIDPEASLFVRVFAYGDAGMIGQILDRSEHRAKTCPNRKVLDLAVAWTRVLLELPWFGAATEVATGPTLDHAAAAFRDFAERARKADDRRMERLALQVSDILAGSTSKFSERLAGALSDEDIGLAMTLTETTAALAIRQLVFAGEYAPAVRALEQLQWSLYRERLFLSSAMVLKRLTAIYGLYPQRIARAAAMTEYVHRLGKYIECDPDVRFRTDRGCDWPSLGYERALRSEWGDGAVMRLGFVAQLAMEWSSTEWMDKVNTDRAALSSGMIPTDISRGIDAALVGMSQYVEATIKMQSQINCQERLRLSSRLANEFAWSRTWNTSSQNAAKIDRDSRSIADISSFVAANRAHFVHCDPAAERDLRENLEGFDPVAVLEAAKSSVRDNRRVAAAVDEILDKFSLAIFAGFGDLASKWFERLKYHGEFEDKALAVRFFGVQVAVARSAEEVDAAMSNFLPLVSAQTNKHDPEQFHEITQAAIQIMTQSGLVDKALQWLEDGTAHRSYNFRVSMDIEPRRAEAFERASLERRLIFIGSLPEADWSCLHELRMARVAPDGSSSDKLPLDAIQELPKRLPAGTAVVRFHFFDTFAVAFVVEPNRPVRVVELARDLNPLMLRLEKFVASLVWGVDVSEDARWVYDSFIKPLNLSPSLSRLIIVPGDFLSSVPFEMLPEPSGRRLGERLEVAYTGRIWRSHAAPMPHIRSNCPALLVGIDSAGLVHAEDEVHDVAQLFETSVVVSTSDASQETVQRHLGRADVVHFATHSYISSIDPFSSAMVLGEGQKAPFGGSPSSNLSPSF